MLRRVLGVLVAGGATVALLLTPGAYASAASAFHTPQSAAECFVPAVFEASFEKHGHLECWTPNDGFTVAMSISGRVSKSYRPEKKGYHDYFSRQTLLRFGADWSYWWRPSGVGRFYWLCKSRKTGLTCTNRAGHGWWLGRYRGYRIF